MYSYIKNEKVATLAWQPIRLSDQVRKRVRYLYCSLQTDKVWHCNPKPAGRDDGLVGIIPMLFIQELLAHISISLKPCFIPQYVPI